MVQFIDIYNLICIVKFNQLRFLIYLFIRLANDLCIYVLIIVLATNFYISIAKNTMLQIRRKLNIPHFVIGEKVDIHIMKDAPAGEWTYLSTEVTDKNGRIIYKIPDDKMLGYGLYPVKMVVR